MQVEVYPEPAANFIINPQSTTILNTNIYFTDLSIVSGDSIVSWLWDFGDGNTDTVQNTSFQFPSDTGVYPVQLLVTTSNGCVHYITLYVMIEGDNTLFIPTAFSPNSLIKENQYLPDNKVVVFKLRFTSGSVLSIVKV